MHEIFGNVTTKDFETCFFILFSEVGIECNIKTHRRRKAATDLLLPDSTMDYLEENGYVLEYGSEGQAHIECPFSDEHTQESGVSATTYFPKGSRGYEQGHFKCFHAHCEGREDVDFEEALGVRLAMFEDLTLLEAGRRKFEAIPLHEFVAEPTPPWMIKGILPETGMAMIYGASGSGKSFLAIDLALSIALGEEWCGRKVNQGSVVYVAAEGAGGIRKRFKAYARQHSINPEDIPINAIQDAPNLHGNDATLLLKEIQKVEDVRVVIVDTLAQVSPGADENSAKDMGAVLNRCKKVQEETGALVVLIHHSGKDASKGARGWSGMFAAMDTVIEVSSKQKKRKAKITKQKDGEDGTEFPFELRPITLGYDEDGDEITSCFVQYTEPDGITPDLRGVWQERILEVACELEVNEIPVKDFLDNVVSSVEPPEDGKRDSRRDGALRALRNISEQGVILFDGNIVSFPQDRNSSQSDKCEDAA